MKVLLCHNHYQQPGGEDQVFEDETRLLRQHGHDVVHFTLHNDAIEHMGAVDVAKRTLWNREVRRQLLDVMHRQRPDVMHCTNIFPLISPAAYSAARASGVAVVQSLHNFRWLCVNASFLRNGKSCEDCLGRRIAWPGIVHACYRDRRAASAAVAAMQSVHRLLGTLRRGVDVWVALSDFARDKFVQGGFPKDRIVVKPNFVDPDPGPGAGDGGYAAFVGRLSFEKGIETLLAAWNLIGDRIPLKILGDGPKAGQVKQAVRDLPSIEWLGQRSRAEVDSIIGQAACVIVPSTTYENCPKVPLEACARGTPVVASRLGSLGELVQDGCNGLRFRPGDAADLAEKVRALLADPHRDDLRRRARDTYVRKYTMETNHQMLMGIYDRALRTSPVLGQTKGHASPVHGPAPSPLIERQMASFEGARLR